MGDRKLTLFERMSAISRGESFDQAAKELGATPVDGILGLWNVPGHNELSTTQMLSLWYQKNAGEEADDVNF